MLVEDAMTEDVVTVSADRSLRDAVERMIERRIGSVIVVRNADPVGIVTETDVLTAGYRTGRALSAISIEATMSHPLVTIRRDATIRAAVDRMRSQEVKKLPVTEELDLVGILTHQDVVHHHSSIVKEAIHHEERRREWEEDAEGN